MSAAADDVDETTGVICGCCLTIMAVVVEVVDEVELFDDEVEVIVASRSFFPYGPLLMAMVLAPGALTSCCSLSDRPTMGAASPFFFSIFRLTKGREAIVVGATGNLLLLLLLLSSSSSLVKLCDRRRGSRVAPPTFVFKYS